jgi:glycerophosphoryl diester phosphodiesterase
LLSPEQISAVAVREALALIMSARRHAPAVFGYAVSKLSRAHREFIERWLDSDPSVAASMPFDSVVGFYAVRRLADLLAGGPQPRVDRWKIVRTAMERGDGSFDRVFDMVPDYNKPIVYKSVVEGKSTEQVARESGRDEKTVASVTNKAVWTMAGKLSGETGVLNPDGPVDVFSTVQQNFPNVVSSWFRQLDDDDDQSSCVEQRLRHQRSLGVTAKSMKMSDDDVRILHYRAVQSMLENLPMVEVQAREGGRGLWAPGTELAFGRSMEMGVDTIEFGVVVTKGSHRGPGSVVVHHERRIDATTVRDTQAAVPGDPMFPYVGKAIRDLTLQQIATLRTDVVNPDFADSQIVEANSTMLSLRRVCDLAEEQEWLGTLAIRFDTDPYRSDHAVRATVKAVLAELADRDVSIRILACDWRVLKFAAEFAPEVDRVALFEPNTTNVTWMCRDPGNDIPAAARAAGATRLSPRNTRVSPEFLDQARRAGLPVEPGTVNDPVEMRSLITQGVQGIVTDFPDLLRTVVLELGLAVPESKPAPDSGRGVEAALQVAGQEWAPATDNDSARAGATATPGTGPETLRSSAPVLLPGVVGVSDGPENALRGDHGSESPSTRGGSPRGGRGGGPVPAAAPRDAQEAWAHLGWGVPSRSRDAWKRPRRGGAHSDGSARRGQVPPTLGDGNAGTGSDPSGIPDDNRDAVEDEEVLSSGQGGKVGDSESTDTEFWDGSVSGAVAFSDAPDDDVPDPAPGAGTEDGSAADEARGGHAEPGGGSDEAGAGQVSVGAEADSGGERPGSQEHPPFRKSFNFCAWTALEKIIDVTGGPEVDLIAAAAMLRGADKKVNGAALEGIAGGRLRKFESAEDRDEWLKAQGVGTVALAVDVYSDSDVIVLAGPVDAHAFFKAVVEDGGERAVRDDDPYPHEDASEVSEYYVIAFDSEGHALEEWDPGKRNEAPRITIGAAGSDPESGDSGSRERERSDPHASTTGRKSGSGTDEHTVNRLRRELADRLPHGITLDDIRAGSGDLDKAAATRAVGADCWDRWTPAEKRVLMIADPRLVGNLPGADDEARTAANLRAMQSDVDEFSRLLEGTQGTWLERKEWTRLRAEIADMLEDLDTVLALIRAPEVGIPLPVRVRSYVRDEGRIRAVVWVGNPQADSVSVFAPDTLGFVRLSSAVEYAVALARETIWTALPDGRRFPLTSDLAAATVLWYEPERYLRMPHLRSAAALAWDVATIDSTGPTDRTAVGAPAHITIFGERRQNWMVAEACRLLDRTRGSRYDKVVYIGPDLPFESRLLVESTAKTYLAAPARETQNRGRMVLHTASHCFGDGTLYRQPQAAGLANFARITTGRYGEIVEAKLSWLPKPIDMSFIGTLPAVLPILRVLPTAFGRHYLATYGDEPPTTGPRSGSGDRPPAEWELLAIAVNDFACCVGKDLRFSSEPGPDGVLGLVLEQVLDGRLRRFRSLTHLAKTLESLGDYATALVPGADSEQQRGPSVLTVRNKKVLFKDPREAGQRDVAGTEFYGDDPVFAVVYDRHGARHPLHIHRSVVYPGLRYCADPDSPRRAPGGERDGEFGRVRDADLSSAPREPAPASAPEVESGASPDPDELLGRLAELLPAGITVKDLVFGATNPAVRVVTAAVREWWRRLDSSERARLSEARPWAVGNLPGVPYAVQRAANMDTLGQIAAEGPGRPGVWPGQLERWAQRMDLGHWSTLTTWAQELPASFGDVVVVKCVVGGSCPRIVIQVGPRNADNLTWFRPGPGMTAHQAFHYAAALNTVTARAMLDQPRCVRT